MPFIEHYCTKCIDNLRDPKAIPTAFRCGRICTRVLQFPHHNMIGWCAGCSDLKKQYTKYSQKIRDKERHKRKRKQRSQVPSLLELSARKVVRNPEALLYLATQNVGDHVWTTIENNIPTFHDKALADELKDLQEEESTIKYRTLGKIFSRYAKKIKSE
jgi:hypothetical protein